MCEFSDFSDHMITFVYFTDRDPGLGDPTSTSYLIHSAAQVEQLLAFPDQPGPEETSWLTTVEAGTRTALGEFLWDSCVLEILPTFVNKYLNSLLASSPC